MIPQVGDKVVYLHPGRHHNCPVPGLLGITVGKEYAIEEVKQCGRYWVKITDDNGKKIELDCSILTKVPTV